MPSTWLWLELLAKTALLLCFSQVVQAGSDPADVVRGLLERRLPAQHVKLFELVVVSDTVSATNVGVPSCTLNASVYGHVYGIVVA